jgi:hypothetical protein
MSSSILRSVMAALLVVGATGGCGDKSSKPVKGSFDPRPLVPTVTYTATIVRAEKRFAGYVAAAARVSLIDPDGEREACGRDIDEEPAAVLPVAGFSGLAALTERELTVSADDGGGTRTFPVDVDYAGASAVGYAAAWPAYAFAAADGTAVQVVRYQGAGAWASQVLPTGWTADDGGDELPVAVPRFAADGATLIVVRPHDGAYVVFTAPEPTAPMADAGLACVGTAVDDGAGDDDDDAGDAGGGEDGEADDAADPTGDAAQQPASLRVAAWDEAAHALVVGDRVGRLFTLTAGACTAPAARALLALGGPVPVTDVRAIADGRLVATQADGALAIVRRAEDDAGGRLAIETSLTVPGCQIPVGASPLPGERWAATCLAAELDDPKAAPPVIAYTSASVLVLAIEQSTATVQATIPLGAGSAAAVGLDGEGDRLLVLRDAALGDLDVFSLSTGVRHRRSGVFLTGVLD